MNGNRPVGPARFPYRSQNSIPGSRLSCIGASAVVFSLLPPLRYISLSVLATVCIHARERQARFRSPGRYCVSQRRGGDMCAFRGAGIRTKQDPQREVPYSTSPTPSPTHRTRCHPPTDSPFTSPVTPTIYTHYSNRNPPSWCPTPGGAVPLFRPETPLRTV